MLSLILIFNQLCHCFNMFKMLLPQLFKAVSQCARKIIQHPVFDIPILNYIGNIMGNHLHHLKIFWIGFHIIPECLFVPCIRCRFQIRRIRIPTVTSQIIGMCLRRQEVRIKDMTQFMCEHAAYDLVAVFPPLYLRDHRIPGIDTYKHIIC